MLRFNEMPRGTRGRAASTPAAWGPDVHSHPSYRLSNVIAMLSRPAALLLCFALAIPAAAQASGGRGAMATRAELGAAADSLARAGNAEGASAVRRRLEEGDFAIGDRIVLLLQTDSTIHDTVTVRDGQLLRIARFPDVSLHGVLRSELQQHLVAALGRIIREPQVEVTPLLRLGIFGEVAHPGYYWTTADLLLSDAMMVAGGPTSQADPSRTLIRRNARQAVDPAAVRTALSRGETLDQIGLHAGDEIVVGRKSEHNMTAVIQTTAVLVGLALSVFTLARSH